MRKGKAIKMIHCYKLGGLNIVLDVYSGSVHVVDDASYDIIGMYESKTHDEIMTAILEKYAGDEEVSAEEIEKCFKQIEELKEDGKLFTADSFVGMAGDLKERNAGVVKGRGPRGALKPGRPTGQALPRNAPGAAIRFSASAPARRFSNKFPFWA